MTTERCLCGAAVQCMTVTDDLSTGDLVPRWVHMPGSDTRCRNVRRMDDVLPPREFTQAAAKQMAELNDRTRRAAGELERFQSIAAELSEDITDMRHQLNQHMAIKRSTLTDVWERLVSEGHLDAALTVREMMLEAGDK